MDPTDKNKIAMSLIQAGNKVTYLHMNFNKKFINKMTHPSFIKETPEQNTMTCK